MLFDIDSKDMIGKPVKDLLLLFYVARVLDTRAMWCFQGENFIVGKDPNEQKRVKSAWDTFPSHTSTTVGNYSLDWNLVHFCRGVGGMLFKPKHFQHFWYNQSEYHESCFWDDDRWVSVSSVYSDFYPLFRITAL